MRLSQTVRCPRLGCLSLVLHAFLGAPEQAWALPQGGQVVHGSAVISQPSPGTLHVRAGDGAIVRWQGFSIGAGELARFIQPSAHSAVLNRVTGAEASQLLGQLQANGRVFLLNPNGIVIGAGARIDTGSFIASTLDMADADFLAGRLRFAGSASAGIRQEGRVVAPGGQVVLVAPRVENHGVIETPGGQILLAAGRSVEIASPSLEGVQFAIQAPGDSVLNLGQLLADQGAVRAFAGTLTHGGQIRAERLVQDAEGRVALVAAGDLLLADGSSTAAGHVSLAAGGRVQGAVQAQDGVSVSGASVDVRIDAPAVHLATAAGSGGGIVAALQGTTRLRVDADGPFQVSVADAALASLSVNTRGERAVGSAVTASLGDSRQWFQREGEGVSIGSAQPAGRWDVQWRDTAMVPSAAPLNLSLEHRQAGSFDVSLASRTDLWVEATLGQDSLAASLALQTGGAISLAHASTRGGAVSALSRESDIRVRRILTSGAGAAGDVALTAAQGRIVVLNDALGIVTAAEHGPDPTLSPGGAVRLHAPSGSIGPGLQVAYPRSLDLRARNVIQVELVPGTGPLESLTLEAPASGSGSLLVQGDAPLELGRVGGRLVLAGWGAAPAGSVRLAATDGALEVTGSLAVPGDLVLDARGGSLSLRPAGAMALVAGGRLDLRASAEIDIASGAGAGDSIRVQGHAVHLDAGGELRVEAVAAPAEVRGLSELHLVAGSLRIQGGASVDADAALNARDLMTLATRAGGIVLAGGAGGSASIDPDQLQMVANGDLALSGGGGGATIVGGQVFFTGSGGVNLLGGTVTALQSGLIQIPNGTCLNCATHLIGPFTVRAYVPPESAGPAAAGLGWVTGQAVSLSELAEAGWELVPLADGQVLVRRRQANLCS